MDLLIVILVAFAGWLWFNTPSSTGAASQDGSQPDNLSKLTQGVASIEGYFKSGSLPQRTNNPGNIGTYGGKIASYPDAGQGFEALQVWIQNHAAQNPNWDFYDMFHYYLTGDTLSPGGPGQSPDSYAEYVANYVGVDPTTPVSTVIG